METHPPVPPFTRDTAIQKVRGAEDGWNSRNPEKVALAYTPDSRWRNRAEFVNGRDEIVAFLARKWAKELDYRLIKELWAFTNERIAVRFAYEWHDDSGNWFRSYGNENWEFAESGLMRVRHACINDLPICRITAQESLASRASPGRPSRFERLGFLNRYVRTINLAASALDASHVVDCQNVSSNNYAVGRIGDEASDDPVG